MILQSLKVFALGNETGIFDFTIFKSRDHNYYKCILNITEYRGSTGKFMFNLDEVSSLATDIIEIKPIEVFWFKDEKTGERYKRFFGGTEEKDGNITARILEIRLKKNSSGILALKFTITTGAGKKVRGEYVLKDFNNSHTVSREWELAELREKLKGLVHSVQAAYTLEMTNSTYHLWDVFWAKRKEE
jgi:hypothetical protein